MKFRDMLQNLKKISPLPDEVVSFINDLASNENIDRIIVFGSRVFGDYEKYSDLDLAIDCPRLQKLDWLKLKEYTVYDLKTIIRISLVHYHSNPQRLKNSIIKSGEIIYARQT